MELLKTKILSRYTMIKESRDLDKIVLISLWKVAGVLNKSKGRTRN